MKFLNKFANWYFNKNSLPYWSILILDNLIVYSSFVLTFLLFHRMDKTAAYFGPLTLSILVYLVL